MAQVYDYDSKKNALKVMYNFVMHDSLPPCSELNKNLKQIDYPMLAVQFEEGSLGFLLIPCLLCFPYAKYGK